MKIMEGSGCGEVPCPSRSRSPPAWADYSRETIKMVSIKRHWHRSHDRPCLTRLSPHPFAAQEDDEKEQMDHLGSRSTQCMDGAPEPVDLRGHQPPKAADLSNRQGEQRPRARGGESTRGLMLYISSHAAVTLISSVLVCYSYMKCMHPAGHPELLTPVAVQRVGAVTPDGRQVRTHLSFHKGPVQAKGANNYPCC